MTPASLSLLQHLPVAMAAVGRDGVVLSANPAFDDLLGGSFVGMTLPPWIERHDGPDPCQVRSRHLQVSGRHLHDGVRLMALHDVTALVQAREVAEEMRRSSVARAGSTAGIAVVADPASTAGRMARPALPEHHDALTGLELRTELVDRVRAAITRGATQLAVLIVDVDRLKTINDTFGHAAGDIVLRTVADTLRTVVGEHPVGRYAGDEFLVLLEIDHEQALLLARRLAECLHLSIAVPGCGSLSVSACVGLAFGPSPSAEALLYAAEAATRRAKEAGRGRVHVLEDVGVGRQRVLGPALTEALSTGALRTHYQPVVDLRTGAVRGFEALVRWPHPRLGLLGPGAFLPVAEALDLLDAVDEHVLHEACREARSWALAGCPATVSVNVSPPHLAAPGFTDVVRAALASSGLDPGRLVLEVTETAVVADVALARRVLAGLRHDGVRVALDDFGTGYSSLLQLRDLPFDTVKIDREFVAGLPNRRDDTAICASVLSLTDRLGKRAIGEGVETPAQAEALRSLGCAFGQGYLWSPAVDGDTALEMLREQPWLSSATPTG